MRKAFYEDLKTLLQEPQFEALYLYPLFFFSLHSWKSKPLHRINFCSHLVAVHNSMDCAIFENLYQAKKVFP